MSNRKSILVLLLLLAALVAAHVMVRVRKPASGREGARTLLDAAQTYSQLTIERRGTPTVRLVRNPNWQLQAPYSAVADEQVVARLLDVLSFTPVSDMIAESELVRLGRSYADFSLADSPLRISAVADKGTVTEISFGSLTPSSDGFYASLSGRNAVLIVPTNVVSVLGGSPSDYRRRSLFRKGAEEVFSFDVKLGKGASCSFARTDLGWTSQSGQASRQQIDAFLEQLLSAQAVEFVWPNGGSNEDERVSASLLSGYGLDPESAVTVSLKNREGVVRQISFGKDGEDGSVYAFMHEDASVVTVPASLKETAQQASTSFRDARLFPLEPAAVTRISLQEGEQKYAFAKDGERTWRLEAPIAAPADVQRVEEMLTRILNLSTADVQESEEDGIRLSLATNVPPVCVAREKLLGQDRLDDFRAREIVRIDPASVKRLVRSVPSGKGLQAVPVLYDRVRRVWNVESAEEGGAASGVNADNVAAVLETINPLNSVRVEKLKVAASDLSGYGLDNPVFALAVDLEQERAVRRNILVGGETRGGRFATVGSSDAVFVISNEVFERLSAPLLER